MRTKGPSGPEFDFSADVQGRRYEMGQVISRPGAVTLQTNVTRAIGQHVVWIKNGDVLSEAALPPSGELALKTTASPGDWFTVVVRQGNDPTVFANAIFVGR